MTDDEIIQQAGTEWNQLRGTMKDYLATVIRIAREDERKACAKVCYEIAPNIHAADQYAAAIRARGSHGIKP